MKFLIFFALLLSSFSAHAGLAVFPNRVELNEKENSAEVRLINKGKEEVTYRISLQNLRMNEDGIYSEVAKGKEIAGENFAEDYLRYSPRRVTLKPNQSQAVRILFLDRSLENGEYRTHMLFREEPSTSLKSENNIEKTPEQKKQISIVLKPLFGVSIPVIFQKGELNSTAEFGNISLQGNKINFVLKRSGNASLYGNLEVLLKDSAGEKKIAELNGISLLYPYKIRKISVELKDVDLSKINKNEIFLRFISKNTAKVLAEGFVK